jgi:hypothetical protein
MFWGSALVQCSLLHLDQEGGGHGWSSATWLAKMGYGRGGWYTPREVNLWARRGWCSAMDSVPLER